MTEVVFLAGLGRSGTTLLERTLAEVDGVTALGEVMHLWDRGLVRNERCACGERFLDCPFWDAIGERAFGGWDRVDPLRMAWLKGRVDRALRVPSIALARHGSFARLLEEYVDRYRLLYDAAAAITGDVLVDSSKQVSLAWCLAVAGELDLRVVHCVRDSRGVGYSWSREVSRPEAVSTEYATMPRYSPLAISAYWMLHNAEIELLARRVPLTRLRYEDFVAAPRRETLRLLDVVGVASEAAHVTDSAVRLGSSHSCAGNPMRFVQGEIPVRADARWRTDQPLAQRRLITSLTSPLLLRYGYR